MAHTHRFSPLRSLFISALLAAAACGGSPEVPSAPSDPTAGSGSLGETGGRGGGTQLDLDGGDTSHPATGGDSGATGEPSAVCGDGKLEAPETCDDGGTVPGDGCSGTCLLEKNWTCPTPGEPCIQGEANGVCGNGEIEPQSGETCDLGENATGKSLNDGKAGCDAQCHSVPGWTCPGGGVPCTQDEFCGDGKVSVTLGEQCDDGSNDGAHGCETDCHVITGWKCPPTGGACEVDEQCGNGVLDSGERCDDHNLRNYDGCSSTCFLESGFKCPAAAGPCERSCGNGKLDSGETCDDSNFYSGDGCSSACLVEENYLCSTVGQTCTFSPPPPPALCGNGVIETGEICDDGNAHGGDGCSGLCAVETGWKCTAQNIPCVATQCGDGVLAGNEQCDDGIVNTTSGCTPSCTIAPNASCPANGGPCVPMVCGDGYVTGTEQCDTGSKDGQHGCSTTCQVVDGWSCPLANAPCTEKCGDGMVVGDEQCDEQADVACCSSSCKLKTGFVCDPSKTPHSQPATPYCGNGVVNGPSNAGSTVRGSEQCDDGNIIPFDGCSPTCSNEPLCGTVNTYVAGSTAGPYQCFARCGDGLVLPPEQCDDGNTLNNDGCDSSCKVELVPGGTAPAWTCSQPAPGALVTLPVIWRDFSSRSHPQFAIDPLDNRRLPDIALPTLQQVNVGGPRPYRYVPGYNPSFKSPATGTYQNISNWTMNGPGWVTGSDAVLNANQAATLTTGNANPLLTPAGRFKQWYLDDGSVNKSFASTINLKGVAGAYQYSCDSTACDSAFPAGGFFPLDGRGWVATAQELPSGGHNYSFTTEMRSWFAFKGGEQLAFYGDDDVWVFINGQLTLDIGGIHSKLKGNFTLNTDGTATSCVQDLPGDAQPLTCKTVALGLVANTVYEIAIFNAERHVVDSNFQLTLTGFNSAPSVCTPICGDGYAAGSEQCDRGILNVPPTGVTYGNCTTECKLGPYCGDKTLQNPPEVCDNSLNIDLYTKVPPTAGMCAPGCALPSYCGDGLLQKVNGEECDEGTAGNQNTYGHCQTTCKLGQRCGDGVVNGAESCDDGAKNGSVSSACDATCKKKCGNGSLDDGEQCDSGTGASGNGSPTSNCAAGCKLKCGNGMLDPGEQCDDGKNTGDYGTCKKDCTFAPYCGDKSLQAPPEVCDKGAANSSTAYGSGSCTDQCLPGGYCGDGVINGSEKCDDGKNTGLPGSCKADCSAYVPSTLCGDGTVQPPEQCDDGKGATGNATATSKCDSACRFKCGNALVESPEQCDNGVNDGSYGTCNSTCQLAGYCGDSLKNGNEQCDLGPMNVAIASAYGSNVCTKACKAAPFCGDGKVQSTFGEECEGNNNCKNCLSTIPK